jgi:hypothetical protein
MPRKSVPEALQEKGLDDLLTIINMLPPDSSLLEFKDALLLIDQESPNDPQRREKALQTCLSGLSGHTPLPESFCTYVMGGFCWGESINEAIMRYLIFWAAHQKIYELALINERGFSDRQFEQFAKNFGRNTWPELDEDHKLRYRSDLFVEATSGIDPRLIRSCKVCQVIFFARRKDQKCCNSDHANQFRVQRWRQKSPDEKLQYNIRRVEKEAKREREQHNGLMLLSVDK